MKFHSVSLAVATLLTSQALLPGRAEDNRMLLNDTELVSGVNKMIDSNQQVGPRCEALRKSNALEKWRLAYLHGDDKHAAVLLKQILQNLNGDNVITPVLENLYVTMMYEEDKQTLPERTSPLRFFSDFLTSAKGVLGPDNILVADIYQILAKYTCDKKDNARRLSLLKEELRIRKINPKRAPVSYLAVVNNFAINLINDRQFMVARQVLLDGISFAKTNGLERTQDGKAAVQNLKWLEGKQKAAEVRRGGSPNWPKP